MSRDSITRARMFAESLALRTLGGLIGVLIATVVRVEIDLEPLAWQLVILANWMLQ